MSISQLVSRYLRDHIQYSSYLAVATGLGSLGSSTASFPSGPPPNAPSILHGCIPSLEPVAGSPFPVKHVHSTSYATTLIPFPSGPGRTDLR